MNTAALNQSQAQRRIGDQYMMTRLFNHLKSPGASSLNVPKESSLGRWLRLYRQAINRPVFLTWAKKQTPDLSRLTLRDGTLENAGASTLTLGDGSEWQALSPSILEIADIIDPDALGLPYLGPGDEALQLSGAQALRFYGYPPPQHHGQFMLITQAIDQRGSFADPGLNNGLNRLNQDLHTLADTLETLLEDTDFNGYASYRTYLRLRSGSFWDITQQAAAGLLEFITNSPAFLALEQVQGLKPNEYSFNPVNRQLSGRNACGVLENIGIESLLALPLHGKLEQLIDIAEQLGTSVHQSGLFSLAQLLKCHDLPIPDNTDEAQALIQQLRQSRPLTVLPISDLANADIALMRYQQRLALEQESIAVPMTTELGDYHQALGITLAQRIRVLEVVNTWLSDTQVRLFDELSEGLLNGKTPQQICAQAHRLLKQMLNQARARQLGQRLMSALDWYGQNPDEQSNHSSLDHLVLAALILDLDLHAGEQRYFTAGFDLVASAQWAPTMATLREDLELHLVRSGKVRSDAAPLAAHLLLAGCAPELLVQAMPKRLRFMTSIDWMSLKQGVMIAHAVAPGSAQFLTYSDAIALTVQGDTTAHQQQWRAYTTTQVLLDWAIARGELPPRTDGTYTPDEIDTVKHRLKTRLEALKEAFTTFASEAPTRTKIALDELKKIFPDQLGLEHPCLRWAMWIEGQEGQRRSAYRTSNNRYSLVDLYLNGWLGDLSSRWISDDSTLDLHRIRLHLGELRDINTLLDTTFNAYLNGMKHAYGIALDDLLAQLPRADRLRLETAEVQVLVLKKEATKAEALETEEEKNARLGRFGVIVRCTQAGVIHEYELFPLLNLIQKRGDPPLVYDLGGKPLSVATGLPRSATPFTTLYTGNVLAVDWQAYSTGSPPRPHTLSTVVVERLWSKPPRPALSTAPLAFGSAVNRDITQAIVQRHFFLDADAARVQASGVPTHQHRDNFLARLKPLVPLWSCTEDLLSDDTRRMTFGAYQCLLDLFGLLFPARKFSASLLVTLKSSAPLPIKLLQLGQLTTHALITTLNPLDAAPGLLRLTHQGLILLNSSTRQTLRLAIEYVRRRTANVPLLDYARLFSRADVGIGKVLRDDDLIAMAAILHKRQWYAFDPFSTRPYGPPLAHFRLDTALSTAPMRCTNGYRAWVAEPLFDTPPLLIPRSQATDLLEPGRLLRLEHSAPTQLNELASPAYWQAPHGLESACTGARQKRSPIPLICFTKILHSFHNSLHKRRAQALEHLRIIPAPSLSGAKRQLVHNHQVYEVTPQWVNFELTQPLAPTPVRYRTQVIGKLIEDEPQFGLPGEELDALLTQKTCVIKLQGIAEGIDDSRVLRALVIELSPPATLLGPRWVVEADAGIFYATLPCAPEAVLLFERLDFSLGTNHERLIRAFCDEKMRYLKDGGLIPDQPLVTLPTLEALYRQLQNRGFSAQTIASLRKQAATLPPLKQRELLLNASDQGQRLEISVASRPLQLNIWPPPATVPEHINQYLAEQANTSTLALVQRTGMGSANIVGTGPAEIARLEAAESLVMWQYSKIGHPDYTDIILKTGAGNCDQMAHVAHELINVNGGTAHIWGMQPPAHSFVVVGTPPPTLTQTYDFSEPEWKHLWICDPWASVVCEASDYLRKLEIKMIEWDLQDILVFFNDQGQRRWAKANDPRWRGLLNRSLKRLIR